MEGKECLVRKITRYFSIGRNLARRSQNSPVLFLGKDGVVYILEDRWSAIDTEVLPYHWDDRQKLYADY